MTKPTEKASEVIHVLRRRERRHLSDRVKVQQTCNDMKGIDLRQALDTRENVNQCVLMSSWAGVADARLGRSTGAKRWRGDVRASAGCEVVEVLRRSMCQGFRKVESRAIKHQFWEEEQTCGNTVAWHQSVTQGEY